MKKTFLKTAVLPALLLILTSCPDSPPPPDCSFSAAVSGEGTGTGLIDSTNTTPDGTYPAGTAVTVLALADTGSYFNGWYDAAVSGSHISDDNPYTFELGSDTAVYAGFIASSLFPVINEVYYDDTGAGTEDFIEILMTAGINLSGFRLSGINGSNGEEYGSLTIPSGTLVPSDGFLLVSATVATANSDIQELFNLQNGPDSIQLLAPSGAVRDAVAYGTFADTDFPAGEGDPCAGAPEGQSIGRQGTIPDADTDNNADDFSVFTTPTPGAGNL